jgi:hypothetical protein
MYLSIKDLNDNLPKVKGVIFAPFLVEHAMNIAEGEFAGYSASRP